MPDAVETPAALLCPQCGYDLRMLDSERCPECGLDVARAEFTQSALPWTYRRKNGRLRSYLRTAWLATFGGSRFTNEIARPVNTADAQRFWLITGILVAVPIVAGVMIGRIQSPDWLFPFTLRSAAVPPTQVAWVAAFEWDVAYPVMVGWMTLPLAICLPFAALLSVFKVLPMLLNRRAIPAGERARATALAHYACAPTVLWLIAILGLAILAFVIFARERSDHSVDVAAMTAGIGVSMLTLGAFLIFWLRSSSIYMRFRHGGIGTWLIAAVLLPIGWMVCCAFWLVAVPWVIGLLWIFGRLL